MPPHDLTPAQTERLGDLWENNTAHEFDVFLAMAATFGFAPVEAIMARYVDDPEVSAIPFSEEIASALIKLDNHLLGEATIPHVRPHLPRFRAGSRRMSRYFFFVQPAYEPNGPGNGWDDADLESQATAYWIKGQNLDSAFDYTLDAMDETREGAQEIAEAWNTRHGIKAGEDGPTEAESCAIKTVIRTGAVPAGGAAPMADPVLALALEEAFPNEAAEVGDE